MSDKDQVESVYDKAKAELEARKESVANTPKEEFMKSRKKPSGIPSFLLIGAVVLIIVYMFAPEEKKDKKETASTGGLVKTLGTLDMPKNNEFIGKPDMPLPEEEKPFIKELPPLPAEVKEKEAPEWFTRKLKSTGNIYSSTNEKAQAAKEQQETAKNNQQTSGNQKITNKDYESPFEDEESELSARLKPTVTASVKAGILPNRDYLITKGTSIDCTLVNAIDTSVEGFVTCRTSNNVYSESGRVLLLERGSKVVGEYRSMGRNMGEPRLFILWTRLTTPLGVAVELNSVGTDSLGRAGVSGDVDNFWFKRFGSAFLTSIMQDSLQILNSQLSNNNSGSGGVNVSSANTMNQSEKLVEELLAQSRGIMPRLVKNQGEIIRIYVSRDINFDQVYQLKRKH